MILKLKIEPIQYKAKTKSQLLAKITSGKFVSMSSSPKYSFCGYANFEGTKFTVFNLHKVRAKAIRIVKKGKQLNMPLVKPLNKKVSINQSFTEGYWIAYVYTFDKQQMETFRLRLEQKNRTFALTSKLFM
jgi:hypothetical protein